MRATIAGRRRYGDALALVGMLAAVVGLGQASAAGAAADEPGVWQPQHLHLYYLGFTATYTCEGLKVDLEGLLKQSGARQIAITAAGPCGSATKLVSAWLKFSVLKPTPSDSGGQIVPGSWHHVTMSPQRYLLQQGGSCELVQEFQKSVLPLFDIRNVKANLNCVPFQSTGYLFSLSFDVFAPSNAKLTSGPNVP